MNYGGIAIKFIPTIPSIMVPNKASDAFSFLNIKALAKAIQIGLHLYKTTPSERGIILVTEYWITTLSVPNKPLMISLISGFPLG